MKKPLLLIATALMIVWILSLVFMDPRPPLIHVVFFLALISFVMSMFTASVTTYRIGPEFTGVAVDHPFPHPHLNSTKYLFPYVFVITNTTDQVLPALLSPGKVEQPNFGNKPGITITCENTLCPLTAFYQRTKDSPLITDKFFAFSNEVMANIPAKYYTNEFKSSNMDPGAPSTAKSIFPINVPLLHYNGMEEQGDVVELKPGNELEFCMLPKSTLVLHIYPFHPSYIPKK